MRNLFICLILGALVWVIQQGPIPVAEPSAYLGLLMVLPLSALLLSARLGLPAHVGPLFAGFLLEASGLLSGAAHSGLGHFTDLALVWIGIYLGSALSPSAVLNRRFISAALATVLGASSTTFILIWILFRLPAGQALQIGLLASLAAPVLAHIALPGRQEARSFSLLVTALGLVLWTCCRALYSPRLPISVPDMLLWGIGIEVVYRSTKKIRTEPGRYLFFGFVAFTVYLAAVARRISPLFLSLASGLALALRCGRQDERLRAMAPLSGLLTPLALAHFTAGLNIKGALQLPAFYWQFLTVYALSMVLGKSIGGLLGSRFAAIRLRDWYPVVQQGLLAAILLPQAFPTGGFFAPSAPAELQAGLILICGTCISILLQPAQALSEYIRFSRSQAAARR